MFVKDFNFGVLKSMVSELDSMLYDLNHYNMNANPDISSKNAEWLESIYVGIRDQMDSLDDYIKEQEEGLISDNKTHIINDIGVPFNVRIVKKDENYGMSNSLTHTDDDPLVEFYDARYPFTEFGQFVSRYFASTLLKHNNGLCLDGYVPTWYITDKNMEDVKTFIKNNIG